MVSDSHGNAEVLAWLPNVERIDAHAVRFVAKDMLEAVRFLAFALVSLPLRYCF